MRGQTYASLLRNGKGLVEETLQSIPQCFVRDERKHAIWRVEVIDHVPNRSVRNGCVNGAVHAHRSRSSAGERPLSAAADPGNAEVISEDTYFCLAHSAKNRMHILNMKRAPGAVEQNVVPVRRIEIFDGFKFEPCAFNLLAQLNQFLGCP